MASNDVVERAKAELRRRRAVAELERRKAAEAPAKEGFDYSFLPLHANADGSIRPAIPGAIKAIAEGAKQAYSAPYRAMTGELPMTDVDGNTSEQAIAEALNMATMASPSSVSLRAGEKMVPGAATNLVPAKEALSAEALKKAAREGYEQAANSGVDFDPNAVKGLTDEITQTLFDKGLIDETAPKTNSLLKRLGAAPKPASDDELVTAPLTSIEAARKSFNAAARNFGDPPDAEAARLARERLDQFLREPPSGAVLSGDAEAASRLYREADKNWAAAKKSDLLTGAEEAADLRAAAANSGQNTGNALRQRIASALINQKTSSRFSDAEKEALEGVVRGTKAENATRYISNLLGGGGGLGQSVTALGTGGLAMAATGGNPAALAAGFTPAIIGALMKKASNRMTEKHLGDVEESIRASAPASQKYSETLPDELIRDNAKEMIIRALMAQKAAQASDQEFWDAYAEGNAF